MLVEVIGAIVFIVGLFCLLGGAMKQPSSGGSYSADGLLIGGAMGVVFGALVVTIGMI